MKNLLNDFKNKSLYLSTMTDVNNKFNKSSFEQIKELSIGFICQDDEIDIERLIEYESQDYFKNNNSIDFLNKCKEQNCKVYMIVDVGYFIVI